MHIAQIHILVTPGSEAAFIAASRANRAGTRQEPGNIRFDCLQQKDDPRRFILFEIFADEAAAKAHKTTPHYHAWRAAVDPLMAEVRVGYNYLAIDPSSADDWA